MGEAINDVERALADLDTKLQETRRATEVLKNAIRAVEMDDLEQLLRLPVVVEVGRCLRRAMNLRIVIDRIFDKLQLGGAMLHGTSWQTAMLAEANAPIDGEECECDACQRARSDVQEQVAAIVAKAIKSERSDER